VLCERDQTREIFLYIITNNELKITSWPWPMTPLAATLQKRQRSSPARLCYLGPTKWNQRPPWRDAFSPTSPATRCLPTTIPIVTAPPWPDMSVPCDSVGRWSVNPWEGSKHRWLAPSDDLVRPRGPLYSSSIHYGAYLSLYLNISTWDLVLKKFIKTNSMI
jgi:hypothetical protein